MAQHPALVHAWCTGQTAMGAWTMCAVVDAARSEDAIAIVRAAYAMGALRFILEREPGWMPSPDRFPL